MRHARTAGMALCALLLGLCTPATGQVARSQLNGTVTDNTDAVLPGVLVTATRVETGVASTATTTGAGVFVIPQLPPGTYTLRATLDGFGPAAAENISLREGQALTINLRLGVQNLTEQVTVQAPVIETSTSEIGRYVSNKEFETWPVPVGDGQRQIQSFIFSSLPGTVGSSWEGSINGGQAFSHEILIEGMPLGRNLQGGGNNEMSPPTEMIQEFKLQTGTISAEHGGGQTAVASFAVKSGTNDLRGSAAYYMQDRALDAGNFVNNALGRPKPLRSLDNGAIAIGGPIVIPKLFDGRNRSFFYGTFEFTNESNLTASNFRALPTAEFYDGDFSRLLDPAYTGNAQSGRVIGTDALGRPVVFGQIYDPRSARLVNGQVVRDPFPGNRIPREAWDPVARSTIDQDLWDLPELDRLLNNQRTLDGCCPEFKQKTYAVKYDQVITNAHRMSMYVNVQRRERNNSAGGRYGPPPGKPTNLYQLQRTPSWLFRGSEQWVISDNLVHRIAFGYNKFGNHNQSVHINQGWPSKIGLSNVPETLFPRFAFGGPALFGGLGNYGTTARGSSNEGSTIFQDDITYVRGRHSLKGGFEGRFYFYDVSPFDDTGAFTFNQQQTNMPGFDASTGHAYASFLLGAVQSASRNVVRTQPRWRSRDYSFFIQDDFKVTSNLTLNLGLRWELIRPMSEKNGIMTTADLSLANTAAGNLPGALVFADEQGRTSFLEPYNKQIQPRLGFAYAFSPKTALSGGYSLSNTPPVAGLDFGGPSTFGYDGFIAVNRSNFPTQFTQDPVMYLSQPFPDFRGTLPAHDPTLANGQGVTVITGDMSRREKSHSFHVTLRKELPARFVASTSYMGNRGDRLEVDGEINRVPFGAIGQYGDALLDSLSSQSSLGVARPYPSFNSTVLDALRPYPQFTSVALYDNRVGKSRYNSFQASIERQFSNGLAVLAAYTLAKAEVTGLSQTGDLNEWRLDPLIHVPQFFKLTWIYELPIGPGKLIDVDGLLGNIIGGWTLSGIHNYRSGAPIAITDSRINGLGYPFRVDVVPGVDPRLDTGGGSVDVANGTPYLNPAAFETQPLSARGIPSRIGTAPAVLTEVRGPAQAREDIGLMKRFRFLGDRTIEFRAEALNVLNRSRLGMPVTDLASPNFGRIFGTQMGQRRVQLSLRATF